jgi:hypothetical protein
MSSSAHYNQRLSQVSSNVSNFGFVKAEWPTIHADCVRAESYLSSDPVAACFYGRRSIEQLVGHLHDGRAAGAVPE